MKSENLEVICPMITPFDNESKPSRDYLKVFLEDMKEYGVTKIFPLGSNGLFNLMTLQSKQNFLLTPSGLIKTRVLSFVIVHFLPAWIAVFRLSLVLQPSQHYESRRLS